MLINRRFDVRRVTFTEMRASRRVASLGVNERGRLIAVHQLIYHIGAQFLISRPDGVDARRDGRSNVNPKLDSVRHTIVQ